MSGCLANPTPHTFNSSSVKLIIEAFAIALADVLVHLFQAARTMSFKVPMCKSLNCRCASAPVSGRSCGAGCGFHSPVNQGTTRGKDTASASGLNSGTARGSGCGFRGTAKQGGVH